MSASRIYPQVKASEIGRLKPQPQEAKSPGQTIKTLKTTLQFNSAQNEVENKHHRSSSKSDVMRNDLRAMALYALLIARI